MAGGAPSISVEMKTPRPKIRFCWLRKFDTTFLRVDIESRTLAWIDNATPTYVALEGFVRNSIVLDADTFCNIASCFEAIPFSQAMSLRKSQLRERLEELEKLVRFFPQNGHQWKEHAEFPTSPLPQRRRPAGGNFGSRSASGSPATSPVARKIDTVLDGQGAMLRVGADGGRGHAIRTLYRNGGTAIADAVSVLATNAAVEDFDQLGSPDPAMGVTVAAAVKRLHRHLAGQRAWRGMSDRLLAMQNAVLGPAQRRIVSNNKTNVVSRARRPSEIAQGFLCPNCHQSMEAMDVLQEHVKHCQPRQANDLRPVSYTHLTLPTIYSV